jgi:hypothetical protein
MMRNLKFSSDNMTAYSLTGSPRVMHNMVERFENCGKHGQPWSYQEAYGQLPAIHYGAVV